MRIACLAFIFAMPLMASNVLTERAKQLLKQPAGHAEAVTLLVQVIAQNPDDAEALTLLGIVRMGSKGITPDDLRTQVEPLFEKALAVWERSPDANPADVALSFEAEAKLLTELDRTAEAVPMQARASGLRKQVVKAIPFAAPSAGAPSRVGSGVSAPSVLFKIDPEYAEMARILKLSGTVLVSVVIDGNGAPTNIQLVRSLGFGLDEKAVEAVSKWKFNPGLKDGQPVSVQAQIEVNFRLL